MASKNNMIENKDGVNLDKIKKELNEYVHKQVDFEVKEVLEKNQKVMLRNKTFVIVRRDIIILLLVFVCLYFAYQLYQVGYFNKYYKRVDEVRDVVNTDIKKDEEEVKEDEKAKASLEELMEVKGINKELAEKILKL
jgi:hypothetical protein